MQNFYLLLEGKQTQLWIHTVPCTPDRAPVMIQVVRPARTHQKSFTSLWEKSFTQPKKTNSPQGCAWPRRLSCWCLVAKQVEGMNLEEIVRNPRRSSLIPCDPRFNLFSESVSQRLWDSNSIRKISPHWLTSTPTDFLCARSRDCGFLLEKRVQQRWGDGMTCLENWLQISMKPMPSPRNRWKSCFGFRGLQREDLLGPAAMIRCRLKVAVRPYDVWMPQKCHLRAMVHVTMQRNMYDGCQRKLFDMSLACLKLQSPTHCFVEKKAPTSLM